MACDYGALWKFCVELFYCGWRSRFSHGPGVAIFTSSAFDRIEEGFKGGGEVIDILKARGRFFFDAFCDDIAQELWNFFVNLREWRIDMHHGDVERFFSAEGGIAFEHGVHAASEGIDVATSVEFFAFCLFGAHIFGGTADDAATCDLFGAFGAADDFGESEVDDFDAQVRAGVVHDEDIFGFKITMDDAFLVSFGEAPGDLERDSCGCYWRKISFDAHDFAQIFAVEPFHDKEHEAVFCDAVIDEFNGIGVHQSFDGADFAFETLDGDGVALEGGAHNFEGDELFLFEIGCHIDEPHAACGDEAFDAESVAKDVSWFEIGSGIVFF